jgi:1,4-alpha-glucan branching enzyme
VLFGLYHPTAARVFVAGTFNDWHHLGQQRPDPGAFVELDLYRGWFGAANTWLAVTERAGVGAEYRFWVLGGTPPEDAAGGRLVVDPYARCLGPDARRNDAEVIDPTTFAWSDQRWRTPDPADLILYEVSVHGFTDGDLDIRPDQQGRFDGSR